MTSSMVHKQWQYLATEHKDGKNKMKKEHDKLSGKLQRLWVGENGERTNKYFKHTRSKRSISCRKMFLRRK